jgi:6-phosphogluconolactonase
MTRETLISHVPFPRENVHAVPTVSAPPDKSAEAYEADLRSYFDAAPEFDLQLLGLGPEEHTASLFPGSSALEENQRWVLPVTAPATPPQRLTLTPVVLNRGRNTTFLVAGKDKREIIAALRNEPDSKPVSRRENSAAGPRFVVPGPGRRRLSFEQPKPRSTV